MSLDTPASIASLTGYTLPVFAGASAIAALNHLLDPSAALPSVSVRLIRPDTIATIPVEQVARLPDGSALAITRSDPGGNLDLTRDTPVWAVVAWGAPDQGECIWLDGGEGIGRHAHGEQAAAIYQYAQTLLRENLQALLPEGKTLRVTIILPAGRSLALRTSNAAFGIVEGLSLLGTSGISEPLSAPEQLAALRHTVREKAQQFETLAFCIGENGLQRALSLGIPPELRIKTANWVGPLLVEAALAGVQGILLLGYHGKLLKLAGGIFHTHHFVADGRQEILTAIAAAQGLPPEAVRYLLAAETAEAGLVHLRQLETRDGTPWVTKIYGDVVERIDARAIAYIQSHADRAITVGSAVFDRQRQIVALSDRAQGLLSTF